MPGVLPELPELEKECFFIAPIGLAGSAERKRSDGVLKFIVGAAARELDLIAVRADQIADLGQITRQVIDHLLGARAAVADLTGLNPNVFYELAVRHTAGLPVVLIAEKGCELPFDIAQMRTIFFESADLESADLCRESIAAQLGRALGGGAVDSPIATSIDMRAMAVGNPLERSVAEIVSAVEGIAKSQHDIMRRLDGSSLRSSGSKLMEAAVSDSLIAFNNLDELVSERGNPQLNAAVRRLRSPLDFMAEQYNISTRNPDLVSDGVEAE
jgi:hypothetical protein